MESAKKKMNRPNKTERAIRTENKQVVVRKEETRRMKEINERY